MKPILLTAIVAAEFLAPYAEAKGFDVGTDGNKVEITNSETHREIEMGKEDSIKRLIEETLSFCDGATDKRAALADFRLFADREDFLDSLPPTVENEEEDEDEE